MAIKQTSGTPIERIEYSLKWLKKSHEDIAEHIANIEEFLDEAKAAQDDPALKAALALIEAAKPTPPKSYHGFKVGEKVRASTRDPSAIFTVCERPTSPRAFGFPEMYVPCVNEDGGSEGFGVRALTRVS